MNGTLRLKILAAMSFVTGLTPIAEAQVGGESTHLSERLGPQAGSLFGRTLDVVGDIDGDGIEDVIVGAPLYNGSASGCGLVEVRSGADGSILHSFEGPDAQSQYGFSVCGAGDLDADGVMDFAFGGYEPSFRENVYAYSGRTGALLHQLQGTHSLSDFGQALACAGDFDGDGHDDLIIGAMSDSSQRGLVEVYSGATGGRLFIKAGLPGSRLGSTVSRAGDLDGDGREDILYAAAYADVNGMVGAGEVFAVRGGSATQLFHSTGTSAYQHHGASLAALGDMNEDGTSEFLIGSPGFSHPIHGQVGAAEIISGGNYQFLRGLVGNQPHGRLGQAAAGLGDITGDGIDDFALAAVPQQGTGSQVWLISGHTCDIVEILGSPRVETDFGIALAPMADSDGDGLDEILIGEPATFHAGLSQEDRYHRYSFHPFALQDTRKLSASQGGFVFLDLDFPVGAAQFFYRVLISTSGSGLMHRGVWLPIAEDSMVHATYWGMYPFADSGNLYGTLDVNGDALVGAAIQPHELHPAHVGRSFRIVVAASPSGLAPAEYSSIAMRLDIQP